MTAKTVQKSLVLLDLLSRSREPRGVAELGRELGLPKSNVFRLLDTLVEGRYVRRREQDSRYELTLKLWEMGMMSFSQERLVEVARPFLDRLANETGESVHLAIYDEGESVFIDKRDGTHPVRGVTQVGSRAPAYCCATGKVALAYCAPGEVARVTSRMKRQTPSTITSAPVLQRELKTIRQQGYAVNRGEWFEDVWGIAAAARNEADSMAASIGIWAPKHRVYKRVEALGKTVAVMADALSVALGCTPKKSEVSASKGN
ncbi:IclR family transcriptional regulator [Ferrovibrio sp.]|uniref:IclR family transcriptional regulator n=1 Tax=Ferrovibrio sp. TaxID=1917215 RepID=UPI003D2D8B9A